jgi:hypothetical protein
MRDLNAREARGGERLPYLAQIDDHTLLLQDDRLLQIVHLEGLLFETADTQELNYRKNLRVAMLTTLSASRFALYHHILRERVEPDPHSRFPDNFSRTLNARWRGKLERKALYRNGVDLSLLRRPAPGGRGWVQKLADQALGAQGNLTLQLREAVRDLNEAREILLASLGAYQPRTLVFRPLEFLAHIYNGVGHRRLLPEGDLVSHVPSRRLSFGQGYGDSAFIDTPCGASDELRHGPHGASRGSRHPAPCHSARQWPGADVLQRGRLPAVSGPAGRTLRGRWRGGVGLGADAKPHPPGPNAVRRGRIARGSIADPSALRGHIHAREKRSGHFWQGRFGCVAMDEAHLAAAICYVALNPVRARLVEHARDWRWSSVHAHLGLVANDGITAAAPVLERFPDLAERIAAGEDEAMSARLRRAEQIGRPVGDAAFIASLERRSGRTLAPAKRGPKSKDRHDGG